MYRNYKIIWLEEGTENYFLSDLRAVWNDKSSFQSSPKSNRYTQRNLKYTLQTVYKSYPQIEWQITYFLVQSYLKLGKNIYFYKFLLDNFQGYPHFFSFNLCNL